MSGSFEVFCASDWLRERVKPPATPPLPLSCLCFSAVPTEIHIPCVAPSLSLSPSRSLSFPETGLFVSRTMMEGFYKTRCGLCMYICNLLHNNEFADEIWS